MPISTKKENATRVWNPDEIGTKPKTLRSLSLDAIGVIAHHHAPSARALIRSRLAAVGPFEVSETGDSTQLLAALSDATKPVHLLVGEPRNDVIELIRDVRRARTAADPFINVLVLTPSAEPEFIRRLIDAGVDGILSVPFSVQEIETRLSDCVVRRRKFVAAFDYVGPDRRSGERKDSPSARAIDPFNPALAAGMGLSDAVVAKERAAAADRLRTLRSACLAAHALRELVALGVARNDARAGDVSADPTAKRVVVAMRGLIELDRMVGKRLDSERRADLSNLLRLIEPAEAEEIDDEGMLNALRRARALVAVFDGPNAELVAP
jgi:CheY-like chemotaxis protein